jgi:hypothetical protein
MREKVVFVMAVRVLKAIAHKIGAGYLCRWQDTLV